MPYRELIVLSYFTQGCHALLSAVHLGLLLQGSSIVFNVFNGVLTLFNLAAFLSAANWRTRLRLDAERAYRRRDFFRR